MFKVKFRQNRSIFEDFLTFCPPPSLFLVRMTIVQCTVVQTHNKGVTKPISD